MSKCYAREYECYKKIRHLSFDLIMSIEVESSICSDNSHFQITGNRLSWAVEGNYFKFTTFGSK